MRSRLGRDGDFSQIPSPRRVVFSISGTLCIIKELHLWEKSESRELDQAYFTTTQPTPIFSDPSTLEEKFFTQPHPIPKPLEGEECYVIGYPSVGRHLLSLPIREDYWAALYPIAHVGIRHVHLWPNQANIVSNGNSDLYTTSSMLGGASGSPAFIFRENRPLIIGIFYEGRDSQSPLLVSRIDYLDEHSLLRDKF